MAPGCLKGAQGIQGWQSGWHGIVYRSYFLTYRLKVFRLSGPKIRRMMQVTSCHCNRISKRTDVMNPYAFTNLLQPTVPVDYRMSQGKSNGSGSGYDMSRAIFRMVCMVESLVPGSGR
jgi:hypothetical protein